MDCRNCYYSQVEKNDEISCNYILFGKKRPENCFNPKPKDYDALIGCGNCNSYEQTNGFEGLCNENQNITFEYTPACPYFKERN